MFDSFSETARLYAQNYSIVEAVKAEFQRDVDAFLDAIYQQIQSATSGRSRQKTTTTCRYWWIGGPDKDRYPQLWLINRYAPEIVDPGELELTAIAPTAGT